MMRLSMRSREFSQATNHSYAKIITTIALALFALFWTTIDGQLKTLDARLRCVETQIAAISAQLGVSQGGLADPQDLPAGHPASARRAAPGITPSLTP